jgi:hypothetical protein
MKWQALPGPASFIDSVLRQIREGVSVAIATPLHVPEGIEDAFVELLAHDRWNVQRATVDSSEDPLKWLTERLYLEPEQWVGWSVERMFSQLSPGHVIVIDGVTGSHWDAWRTFLRDFEVASRQRASAERAVLLVFVRGVPRKRLQASGGALSTCVWAGVFGELDTLVYVDQRLRSNRKLARHHKLLVRQIAALALWDLDLADFLIDQPELDMFNARAILRAARSALGREGTPLEASWEAGGMESVDGVELAHPYVLVDNADPGGELDRRLWAAQASELLPLIEVRRRELAKALERQVRCPFWIDGQRKVDSLDELEIGSLAYVTQTHGIRGELRDRAEWLARCRNTLAHLGLLEGGDALSSRLHA